MTQQIINNIPNHLEVLGFDYFDAASVRETPVNSKYGVLIIGSALLSSNVAWAVSVYSSVNFLRNDYELNQKIDYQKLAFNLAANSVIPAFHAVILEEIPALAKSYHDVGLYFANYAIQTVGDYIYGTQES